MHATLAPRAAGATAQTSPGLSCAEVRGGNAAIDALIELPGLFGRIYSRPCDGGRGGDIHYVSLCSSGLLSRLCVADVVGHGEAVGQVSGEIHGLMQRYMNVRDERRLLRRLNRRLMDGGLQSMTTAVTASYELTLRRLTISHAGHPPAWVYRAAEQRWTRLGAGSGPAGSGLVNLPLAIDEKTRFSRRALRMEYGDRLLVLTDGVLETPDPAGEQFGVKRLGEVLDGAHGAPTELVDRVLAALREYCGPAGLHHDDVTLMVLEFRRGPNPFVQALKNLVVRPLCGLPARG